MTRFLSSSGHRGRQGFTLVEMLVSMTLLSIVIGGVLSLVLSQVRFVGRINRDVLALDQVRAAQDLLSVEIADLSRGAVTHAAADSIAFRLPVQWGVICGTVDRNATQAPPAKKGKVAVTPVYSDTIALQMELAPLALGSPVADGLGLSTDGVSFQYTPVANWNSLAIVSNVAAATACINAAPAAAAKKVKGGKKGAGTAPPTLQVGSTADYYTSGTIKAVLGASPEERTLFFGYLNISYFLKTDASGALVLYRTAKGATQPLAWPFAAGAGFSYRLANGTESQSISAADRPNIRAVRVNLPALRVERGTVIADTINVQPWLYLFNAR